MFEPRARLDEMSARQLHQDEAPGDHGPQNETPSTGPRRPRPRPLRADPPILMIGGGKGFGWPRRVFAWIVFGVFAALFGGGVALLVQSGQSEPVLPRIAQSVQPVPEPAAPPPVAAPDPEPAEPEAPPGSVAPPPERTPDSEPASAPPRAERLVQAPPASPSPTTSAPVRGFLFVNSRPWGRVFVDGRLVGNTPLLRMAIAPGPHELRVERDGFHPFETTITVDPGTNVRITEIVLRSLIP